MDERSRSVNRVSVTAPHVDRIKYTNPGHTDHTNHTDGRGPTAGAETNHPE